MIVVENAAVQEISLKSRFVIFRCQKYVKKGYIEMTKKFYLETFKKCPGPLHFPLLTHTAGKNRLISDLLLFLFKANKSQLRSIIKTRDTKT